MATGFGDIMPPSWGFLDPGELQYMGVYGLSLPGLLAIDTIVTGERIPERASLVTWVTDRNGQEEHLFLFWEWNAVPLTVVHSGFTSGYSGEGPRTFSEALCMIWDKAIPLTQLQVTERLFRAIEQREATAEMLEQLRVQGTPMGPWPWHYVKEQHVQMLRDQTFWSTWHSPSPVALPVEPPVVQTHSHKPNPAFDALDPELAQRCGTLWAVNVQAAIREAYIVVEERLRKLIDKPVDGGEVLTGDKLLQAALHQDDGILTDKSIPFAERQGLLLMFKGAYMYVRNPRAHRFVDEKDPQRTIEFIYFADLLLRCLPTTPPVQVSQHPPTP